MRRRNFLVNKMWNIFNQHKPWLLRIYFIIDHFKRVSIVLFKKSIWDSHGHQTKEMQFLNVWCSFFLGLWVYLKEVLLEGRSFSPDCCGCSAFCFITIGKRTNRFNVKQCRLQTTKRLFFSPSRQTFSFLIKNFITTFQLKDFNFVIFIFPPPSPVNHLRSLIAPFNLLQKASSHMFIALEGWQGENHCSMWILLGAWRVCELTC